MKRYLYNLHSMNTAKAKPQRQSDARVLVKSFLRERIMEKSQVIPFDNSPCQYQQPTKYSNILTGSRRDMLSAGIHELQRTGPSTQQAPLYFVRMSSLALDTWPSSAAAATSQLSLLLLSCHYRSLLH